MCILWLYVNARWQLNAEHLCVGSLHITTFETLIFLRLFFDSVLGFVSHERIYVYVVFVKHIIRVY